MAGSDSLDGDPDDPIPGLQISKAHLEQTIAADRMLIERGLRQHEESCIAMEAQERERAMRRLPLRRRTKRRPGTHSMTVCSLASRYRRNACSMCSSSIPADPRYSTSFPSC
jgi:hypothetical protein